MTKEKDYPYIDIDLNDMKIVDWGTTPNATLTGDTEWPYVHRMFLTPGQFNKFCKKLGE